MKRLSAALAAAAALTACACPVLWAGDPSQIRIRVVGVYFKNQYDRWISAGPVDAEFDLISQEPRLSFANKGQLAAGKYLNVRIALSETIRYAGSDRGRSTLEGGSLRLTGTAGTQADLPGEILKLVEESPTCHAGPEEGLVTVRIDYDYGDRDDVIEFQGKREFLDPIQIADDSTITLRFVMNTAGTVSYAWRDSIKLGMPERDTMLFRFPDKVQEIEIKVDKQIPTLIPDSRIEIRF